MIYIRIILGILILGVFFYFAVLHWLKFILWIVARKNTGTMVPFIGITGFLGCAIIPSIPIWVAMLVPFLDIGFILCLLWLPKLIKGLCS